MNIIRKPTFAYYLQVSVPINTLLLIKMNEYNYHDVTHKFIKKLRALGNKLIRDF